jgi:hypothetical protein
MEEEKTKQNSKIHKTNKETNQTQTNNNTGTKNRRLINKLKCTPEDNALVSNLAKHHIDSFDYAMDTVLKKLHKYIRPIQIKSTEKTASIFKVMTINYLDFELG